MNGRLDELESRKVDSVKSLKVSLERDLQLQQEEHRRKMAALESEFKPKASTSNLKR
jgi:hypothetical protein